MYIVNFGLWIGLMRKFRTAGLRNWDGQKKDEYRSRIFFNRTLTNYWTPEVCILVQIGPPSAKIDIGTHWNTVFNVFWPVESIRDANYGQKSFQSAHLAVSMSVFPSSS